MPLPTGLRSLSPEADLRSVVIRRQENHVQLEDVKLALTRSELAAGLFFPKGQATAQAFRPAYWSYGDEHDAGADETCTVVDIRTAAAVAAEADTPTHARAAARLGMPESGDGGELAALERAFLASQLKSLMQAQEPGADREGTPSSEMSLSPPEDAEVHPPEADLRTIPLRRTASVANLVDGLFLQKNAAAADAPRKFSILGPDEPPADAETTGVETVAGEATVDEPLPIAEDQDDAIGRSADASDMPGPAAEIGEEPPPAEMQVEFEPSDMADPVSDPMPLAPHAPLGSGRRQSSAPAGLAILASGFVALLVSLWVLIDSGGPRPRDDVAAPLPAIASPAAPAVVAPVAPRVDIVVTPPPRALPIAPPVVAPAAPPVAPPAASASPAVESLLAQGNESLRRGDIYTARLFFQRAADAGDAHGALMMGVTYDPNFLASIGVRGPQGDEGAALTWYRRAGDLGAPEAAKLANNLQRK